MATYSQKLRGYIADVPEVFFKRIDGMMFHFDKLSAASATPNVQFTEVNAGQGIYPVAYLPTASTFEISITSAQFDTTLFELATGETFQSAPDYKDWVLFQGTVDTSLQVTLADKPAMADIKINGITLTESDPTATGTAKYTTSTGIIKFYSGDVVAGDIVDVYYMVSKTNAKSFESSNDKVAIGEMMLKWPIYNGGENVHDGVMDAGAILGWFVVKIYRARVTAMPGFDTSYKTAATNQLTVSAMDPANGEHNGNAYSYAYIPKV